ncbi:uncharacterized protein F4822DRAFT_410098 [Hypoxylon trugodes]|uniref:uncharacterized protein n=1 Tax=Hypoxylon trugodes TaxID=326681 RepID=UPI002194EFAA|nr:uncharacterized protein F4822DRAFT_410098 [Hypoxylon trugodes]KAI1386449.1 hypothetical protein F4822DRAFT_410098 [Hypoxylon trugodes]
MCSADLFLGLIAILFPPLPVWVRRGLCSADSIINILLCVLGYIPGLIHSWYIISKFPEAYEYDPTPEDREGGGRVTYVFVQQPESQPRPKPSNNSSQPNYGTNGGASSVAGPANGEGSHGGPAPPTYAEAVKGDNKVQTQD